MNLNNGDEIRSTAMGLNNDEIWKVVMNGNASKLVELLTAVDRGDLDTARQLLNTLNEEVQDEEL